MDIADKADAIVEAERAEGARRAADAIGGRGTIFCEECGDMIEKARSDALPSARTCLPCQEAAERDARRNRS